MEVEEQQVPTKTYSNKYKRSVPESTSNVDLPLPETHAELILDEELTDKLRTVAQNLQTETESTERDSTKPELTSDEDKKADTTTVTDKNFSIDVSNSSDAELSSTLKTGSPLVSGPGICLTKGCVTSGKNERLHPINT